MFLLAVIGWLAIAFALSVTSLALVFFLYSVARGYGYIEMTFGKRTLLKRSWGRHRLPRG